MHKLAVVFNAWPVLAAFTLSVAMIFGTAADQVDIPPWLRGLLEQGAPRLDGPEPDIPEGPVPDQPVPFAPAPGRDDRTPLAYTSLVFGLNDPTLPAKLSGIGPVFWDHGGQATGAMIAPNLVLTTGHLFAENGKWEGPFGLTATQPAASGGRIYLGACGQAYDLQAIHMSSMAPRKRLGLDYAILELAQPVCDAAQILPVARTPDDLAGADDQTLLSMGAYPFANVATYADHPIFEGRDPSDWFDRYAVFGVRCAATGRDDTGDIPEGSTAVIVTEGCEAVPGGSGGPLLVSRDGGASYAIVGVTNSYRKNTEYNNYTRIEGAFAAHLSGFLDLIELPAATSASHAPSHIESAAPLGPWEETIPSYKETPQ